MKKFETKSDDYFFLRDQRNTIQYIFKDFIRSISIIFKGRIFKNANTSYVRLKEYRSNIVVFKI